MDRLREVKAAPSPFRRHSGLDQGSVRHQGAGDPRRLARAGGCAPAEADAPVVARLRAGRLHRDRPHQHDRVRLFRASASIRITARRRAPGTAASATCPAARRRAPRCRSPTAWRMARSAPTPAAPAASRRPSNGIVGFKPTAAPRAARRRRAAVVLARLDRAAGAHASPAARRSTRCWPARPLRPLQPRPSGACGWRCRPRSRSTTSMRRSRATFERALETLSRQGALIERIEVPEIRRRRRR